MFKWAIFYGEHPFTENAISERAQIAGAKEAAEWFLNDARSPSIDGHAVRVGVSRLARLFKEIRFSDKPSECSLCTFSADYGACSSRIQQIVDLAEHWSLLIRIPSGQKDKNKRKVDHKYQINGTLAPYWDLPVSRRGAITLTPENVEIMFTSEKNHESGLIRTRFRREAERYSGGKVNAIPPARRTLFR